MGHYIKLFPIQFELFWIPPLSSSVKLWKLADCLLQLIIGECLDITIDICYMTTMLRTFDHGKQYSIKLSYRKYKIFSCLQLIYRIRDGLSMRFWLATLIFSKLFFNLFLRFGWMLPCNSCLSCVRVCCQLSEFKDSLIDSFIDSFEALLVLLFGYLFLISLRIVFH